MNGNGFIHGRARILNPGEPLATAQAAPCHAEVLEIYKDQRLTGFRWARRAYQHIRQGDERFVNRGAFLNRLATSHKA